MSRSTTLCLIAFAFVVSLATVEESVHAANVAPGSVAFLSGTTAAAEPHLAGTVVLDNLRPFQIHDHLGNVVVSGNVQERVVRSSMTNRLIYAPRIRDTMARDGGGWVMAMDYQGFAGVNTDTEYRVDGLGQVGADNVSRSTDGNNLRFRYDPHLIAPPDEAQFLSISTNALQSAPVGSLIIYAQNDFGASVFSTMLSSVAVPALPGDANLDGLFNSTDLVQVLGQGEFEDGLVDNSIWQDGDWNDDLEFDSIDLVLALSTGQYESGDAAVSAAVRSVPEPSALVVTAVGLIGLVAAGRRYRSIPS